MLGNQYFRRIAWMFDSDLVFQSCRTWAGIGLVINLFLA